MSPSYTGSWNAWNSHGTWNKYELCEFENEFLFWDWVLGAVLSFEEDPSYLNINFQSSWELLLHLYFDDPPDS